MTTINAYLIFNGNCREAMSFYKDCFGGELSFETIKGSPMESHWPESVHNNILHASLRNNNFSILGADMLEQNELIMGNNIVIALICKTDWEIETYFDKLSYEGNVKYPLHNFYNGKIGGIIDKFGIHWYLKL